MTRTLPRDPERLDTSALAHPRPSDREPVETEIDYDALELAKGAPKRDARFLTFIRRHRCAIEGQHECGPRRDGRIVIDAAHIGIRGIGSKATDYHTIPLCRFAHMEQHAITMPRFMRKYEIDPRSVAKAIESEYQKRTVKR